ncbi:MAG: transglycosylase SLT domain-containing protein, partial [Planktothrix sp.]
GKIGLASSVAGIGLFAAASAGMSNLASSASQTRFQSMGLGINAGQLKSAQVNYSSALGSPEQTLSAIRDMQADITQQWKFSAMGIKDYQKKSSAEILPELMKAAQKMAKETPREQLAQVSQAYGVNSYFSIEDLTRFKEMSDAEMDKTIRQAKADERLLKISDNLLERWQLLEKQIKRFTDAVQNEFLNALAPLAPLFTKLSESSLKFIQVFMKSDLMKFLLEKITEGMKEFTDYIASDKPVADLKKFVGYIKTGGEVLGGFLDVIKMITDGWRLLWTEIIKPTFEWIGNQLGFVASGDASASVAGAAASVAGAAKSAASGIFSTNTGGASDSWETGGASDSWGESKNGINLKKELAKAGKKYGFDSSAILANYQSSGLNPNVLLSQAYQESKFNPNAKSEVGAFGFGQFMRGTASRYGLKDRGDAVQSSAAQVRMMQELYKKYGSYELALAAYNGGERGADYLARNPQYLKNPD